MILADKIIALRKKAGWSQEELARQLDVSRQSVSKWEGAQSVPDMERALQLSRLFGVSTDYLLKDEMECPGTAPLPDEAGALRRVTMEEAAAYLERGWRNAPWMGLATLLCIISPTPLLMLAGLSRTPGLPLGEQTAAMILKVADGAKPSELPYETLSEYAKFVNLQAADTLGLTLTDDMLEGYTVLVEPDGTSHFGE